jgi:hypothetical protein
MYAFGGLAALMRLRLVRHQEYPPGVGKFRPSSCEFRFNLALQPAIPIWEDIPYVFRVVAGDHHVRVQD